MVGDRLWYRLLVRFVRFSYWLRGGVYTAGSAAVVVFGDEILLVRPSYRTGWGLPGGAMKWREQAADALVRELVEEVDLRVVPGDPFAVYVQQGRRHIDHLYEWRPPTRVDVAPATRYEIAEAGWFALTALPPLQREAVAAIERWRVWRG